MSKMGPTDDLESRNMTRTLGSLCRDPDEIAVVILPSVSS